MNLTISEARGVAQRCQSLHARRAGTTPADLARHVHATGWLRSLGGIEAYVALHARVDGLERAHVDAALAAGTIRLMPAVRGCIYVVPGDLAGTLLALARHLSRRRVESELEKLGATIAELRDVGLAVLDVLRDGPLATDAIRRKTPPGLVRGFGDLGKKLGVSSNLPGALRELEFEGRVERVLEKGGLDSERYLWRLAAAPARAVGDDPIAWITEVARSFWRHAGFADRADFAEWAGVSQKDAKAALAALALVPVTVEGYGKDVYALPEALDARAPNPAVRLLGFEDNLYALHGGLGPFVDPGDRDAPVRGWGSGRAMVTLGTAKHLESRAITAGGRIAGTWEWDAERDQVNTAALGDIDANALAAERASVRTLVREIGHARSFSLDTDALVQARAAAIRP